jgi:hypothetical protein
MNLDSQCKQNLYNQISNAFYVQWFEVSEKVFFVVDTKSIGMFDHHRLNKLSFHYN